MNPDRSRGLRIVAHALVRAVFALFLKPVFVEVRGVHMRVNAARKSACATSGE